MRYERTAVQISAYQKYYCDEKDGEEKKSSDFRTPCQLLSLFIVRASTLLKPTLLSSLTRMETDLPVLMNSNQPWNSCRLKIPQWLESLIKRLSSNLTQIIKMDGLTLRNVLTGLRSPTSPYSNSHFFTEGRGT